MILSKSVWFVVIIVSLNIVFLFFFFQAEDGIRDLTVTGVQTCALPISCRKGECTRQRAGCTYLVPAATASPSGFTNRLIPRALSPGGRTILRCWTSTRDRKSVV